MNIDRRGFLKGMLGISIAAAALPLLPPAAAETAAISEWTWKMPPSISEMAGRLGRVRIDRTWFPLEDAAFTMMRRHIPPLYAPSALPGRYDVVMPSELVESPWQLQIWSTEISICEFFAHKDKLEFEFDSRRNISFVGNGYLTTTASEEFLWDREALFSITLEGSEKFRRYGEVGLEELEG